MRKHEFHPDSGYGIEIRDGFTTDDYIANARGFSSTAEFRAYRDADEETRSDIRRNRNSRDKRPDDNTEDLHRFVQLARLI
jgi:hypothetical protein